MKADVLKKHGFDGIDFIERPSREPRRGEVVLRMRAASLNYRDLEIVSGHFRTNYPLPLVPLSDGLGEVIAVGDGVTRVLPGDRVIVSFWERWLDGRIDLADAGAPLGGPLDGVLAEEFVINDQRLVRVSPSLSDAEAATLPCAASTAWQALVTEGKIKPGETVVVQGTGGVSLFALQFARMAGARVIVTSSSDEKLERARARGAFGTVNYRTTPEWSVDVLRLTEGIGADHVIEVGGPGSFSQSLKAIRSTGQINVVGYLGATEGALNPLDIFRRQARVRGIPVGSRQTLASIVAALSAGSIKPVIDSTFHWTEVSKALHRLHSGGHFGKITLTF